MYATAGGLPVCTCRSVTVVITIQCGQPQSAQVAKL
jgi:hypothetical protein